MYTTPNGLKIPELKEGVYDDLTKSLEYFKHNFTLLDKGLKWADTSPTFGEEVETGDIVVIDNATYVKADVSGDAIVVCGIVLKTEDEETVLFAGKVNTSYYGLTGLGTPNEVLYLDATSKMSTTPSTAMLGILTRNEIIFNGIFPAVNTAGGRVLLNSENKIDPQFLSTNVPNPSEGVGNLASDGEEFYFTSNKAKNFFMSTM